MSTEIIVTVIATAGVIAAAWIPTRSTRRAINRIEGEFSNNGGSTAKDQLDRIEHTTTHLAGRFDQHLADEASNKELAHREALRMWEAIRAVAEAEPPMRKRQP